MKHRNIIDSFEKRELVIVICLSLVLHLVLYFALGIRYGADTGAYLNTAAYIKKNGLLDFYLHHKYGSSYFIPCLLMAWLGEKGYVLLQILLSTLSLVIFFLILKLIFSHPKRKFIRYIGFVYYLLNFDTFRWSYYCLTDGLYISLTIILLYTLLSQSKRSNYLYAIFLVLHFLTRPVSIAIMIPFILYLVYPYLRIFRFKVVVTSLIIVYTIVFGAVYKGDSEMMMGRNELFFTRFIEGKIFNGFQDYNIIIDSPFMEDDVTDKKEYDSYFSVLLKHPFYSMKYLSVRGFVFVFPVYPHFSLKHNVFNFLYYFPLYIFIMLSFLYLLSKRGLKFLFSVDKWDSRLLVLFISLSIIAPVFHALTQVDPDGRYLAPWTGVPVLFAGVMCSLLLDSRENRKVKILE